MNVLSEMLSYPFMVRALFGGMLVSLCASLLGVSLVLKRYSMMKMEILCFVKITVKHEKKHRSSRIWLILAMPDFLARVKRKLPLRSLNADTNHHFL